MVRIQPTQRGRPELPASLLDGTHAQIIVDFALPDVPYVRPDPGDAYAWQRTCCRNVGPVLLGSSGFSHHPMPCFHPTCVRCGPDRCDAINNDMAGHTARHDSLSLFAIHATDERGLRAKRRTVTRALNTRAGEFLWVTMTTASGLVCLVFASVDHSTTRPNRGQPPRKCDMFPRGELLTYLDFLLWHGFTARRASQGWPLTDSERAKKGTSTCISIGQMGARNFEQMPTVAREIYEQDRTAAASRGVWLRPWPDYCELPPGLDRPGTLHLLNRARTETLARAAAATSAGAP